MNQSLVSSKASFCKLLTAYADLQRKVKEESEIFAEDPYDSNILKGQLKGIKRGCGTSISL